MSRDVVMAEVERIAAEQWGESPGEEGGRVPVTRAGLAAMEVAIAAAADAAEAEPELAGALLPYVRACLWARRPTFVGNWATVAGAVVVVVWLLVTGRNGGTPWLAAALVWAASVPLYLQAAVAIQVDVNAEVISGRRSLDTRFMLWTANDMPPILTPLLLGGRALLYGALAPLMVLVEAARWRHPLPAVVLFGVTALAVLWTIARPLAEGG